jgi:catechol 2,3-dioxygenase-like lactoylglutathione lyase family enzyme
MPLQGDRDRDVFALPGHRPVHRRGVALSSNVTPGLSTGCARHRSQVVLGEANPGLRDLGLAQPAATSERQWEFATIDRIDHIVMNCRDIEATASWYKRALGFERGAHQSPAEPGQRIAEVRAQKFNLRPTSSTGWATCKVDVPGSLDLCFITEGRPPRGQPQPDHRALEEPRHPHYDGPAPRTGALGRMTLIYCEDPDGNLVEVATYSADPRRSGAAPSRYSSCVFGS